MSDEKPDNPPAYIISDDPKVIGNEYKKTGKPIQAQDFFQFDAYAKTLADLIAYKQNRSPLVIGIYGDWGSGKTTLMEKIKELLPKKNNLTFRKCKSIWFQPWKLNNEDAILAGLIEEIFRAMAKSNKGKIKERVVELMDKFSKKCTNNKTLPKLIKSATGNLVDVGAFFGNLSHEDKLGFYYEFETLFKDLAWSYVNGKVKPDSYAELNDEYGVLVIFIDDLDRCKEDQIIGVLETIKLFVNYPGCIIVLGVAREAIIKGLKKKGYEKEEEAEKFMEKIVQVTFDLPQKPAEKIENFIQSLVTEESYLDKHKSLIARSLDFNPRRVKRFLNDLQLKQSLLSNLKEIKFDKLVKDSLTLWTILTVSYTEFARQVRANSKILLEIKKETASLWESSSKEWNPTEQDLKYIELEENLHQFVKNRNIIELVQEFKWPSKEKRLQFMT